MRVVWIPTLALLATCAAAQDPLSCSHPECRLVLVSSDQHATYTYTVEGNMVTFCFSSDLGLEIDCAGAPVLDSPALPFAEPARRVREVTLQHCPPPAGALADTFSALGVSLDCAEDVLFCTLYLFNLSTESPISYKYFAGLERLSSLTIEAANRTSPEWGFLAPLTNLHSLYMKSVDLPPGELRHTPNLRLLDLSDSALRTLPSDMFAVAHALQFLYLSGNELDVRALDALEPLDKLNVLFLSGNSRLSDLCEPPGYSPLRNMTQLKELYLTNTSVSRVCRDWREHTPLRWIGLDHTRVTTLSFEELQFKRSRNDSAVFLVGAPLTTVETSREQFEAARHAPPHTTRVLFFYKHGEKPRLACGCSMYWTRRALDLRLAALQDVGQLPCADGRRLLDVPPEDMCTPHELSTTPELPTSTEPHTTPGPFTSFESHTKPKLPKRLGSTPALSPPPQL